MDPNRRMQKQDKSSSAYYYTSIATILKMCTVKICSEATIIQIWFGNSVLKLRCIEQFMYDSYFRKGNGLEPFNQKIALKKSPMN